MASPTPCASRSWAASSTAPTNPVKPTSVSPPATAKDRIFVRGKTVRTVPEHQIVEALLEEALNLEPPTPAAEAHMS